MKTNKTAIIPLIALGLLSLTGCGSSGSAGSNTSGSSVSFSLPSGVDVLKVDAQGSSNYDDAGTDYSNAQQSFHVSHPVGEALSSTSQIMCFIGQLGIGNMWSEAAIPRVYLVGVDEKKCDSSSGQPSQDAAAGGAGSSAAVALTMVTVRLSREAPGLYPRAEIWFDQVDNGNVGQMRASIDVLDEPTASNPYGKFNLYFKQFEGSVAKGGGNLIVAGTDAAPIAFTFYEKFTDSGQTQVRSASVEMGADGSNLKAAIQDKSPWNGNSAWVVASNGTKIRANSKRSNMSNAGSVAQVDLAGGVCLKTDDFKYRIHGYGLYDEGTGDKVELSTGIQCQYEDGQGKTRNCHIGSNGAWFEPESNGDEHVLTNGDTVTRRAWGDQAAHDGEVLNLFVADGRLRRYTVKKYVLADIHGIEFRMWDNVDQKDYIVKYLDGTDSAVAGYVSDGFYKVAEMQWSMGGPPSKVDLVTAVDVTPGNGIYTWFHSDTMGGVSFVGGNPFVTARIEELVNPTDAAFVGGKIDLKCLNRCPKAPISQSDLTTWSGPYETNPANVGAAIDYVFGQTDMALFQGDLVSDPQVELDTSVTFDGSGSMHTYGIETGAMVEDADLPGSLFGIYDTEGNTYYQYRMGPNGWDKLVIAKLGSTPITFDDPIVIPYTHLTANDRNGDATYNGKKFLLRYQGEGHIDGFPWDQVDRDGDGSPDMWFPQVSLKDNVQLIDVNATNYRIKALYGDLTLEPAGSCAGLSLQLPTVSIPSAAQGEPSNSSTSKPSHGDCLFDTDSQTASEGCG